MLCPCSANNKRQVDMTALFTEKDVEYLFKNNWHPLAHRPEALGDFRGDQLLIDLVRIGQLHEHMHGLYGNSGPGEYMGFMTDIRDGEADGARLLKAFNTFTKRHKCVTSLYDGAGELSSLRTAITNMIATTVDLKSRAGSRHDPKIKPLEISANQLIELRERDNGEPPTIEQGTGNSPAGKFFAFVLERLTKTYGGRLGDAALGKLLKKARRKYHGSKKS